MNDGAFREIRFVWSFQRRRPAPGDGVAESFPNNTWLTRYSEVGKDCCAGVNPRSVSNLTPKDLGGFCRSAVNGMNDLAGMAPVAGCT